jgi:hypothetical protein
MNHIVLLVSTVLLSCQSDKNINFSIVNRSLKVIDTLKITIQSKDFELFNLKSGGLNIFSVPVDSLILNKHDFTIQATGIKKNGVIINGYYYTDLSGIPRNKYELIFYDSTVIIK